jgi:hypothetical protein
MSFCEVEVVKKIPWTEFFKRHREPVAFLQIKPDPTVRNYNVETLAKAFADYYETPLNLFKQKRYMDSFTFETFLSKNEIAFYLTCPERLRKTFTTIVQSVWEKATVVDAPSVPYFYENLTSTAELRYKRHDIFAIDTDSRTNAPMPSLFAVTKEMANGEQALVQIVCEPYNPLQWAYDAQKTHDKFMKGIMPSRVSSLSPGKAIGNVFIKAFSFIDEALNDFFGADPAKKRDMVHRDPEAITIMRKGLSTATKNKPTSDVLRTWIRVVSQSPDENRRDVHVRRISGAFRDLDSDNQLVRKDVTISIADVNQRRPSTVKINGNLMATAEVAKLAQLPTSELQQEYPQIESIRKQEVSLPAELFMADVPGIDIGTVTEKGSVMTARIPVDKYGDTELKYVYDAYCLPEFIFGEMGAGKTAEAIHRAHSAMCLGQTVFFFDTADGSAVRELHDSLPEDYPDEKIIHIDLTNKAWPIALSWAFNPSKISGDDELKTEEAREAAKMFLRQFVSGMATTEFTNRMDRYLAAASRATSASPLDIELALTSPAYREELLERDFVQSQPEIAIELEALQDKARRGSDDVSVDGILSRLRTLSSDRFRTNLFYQTPVKPLDFRKFADNAEDGYGYCVTIYCDKTSFGPDGQEAVMTYLLAKVLLEGAYSRVDIPQDKRKPFVVILDEPHRFIRGEMASKLGEDAAVELRKYRCKLVMMGHSREQLGKLWDAFESGGIQVTLYKSKNVKAFKDLGPIIAPLDPELAWASLGKHEAVVTRKLPSKREVAFICKMAPPPPFVKDRSKRREECAREFGRPWKEVSAEIQARRIEYMEKDQEWYARIAEQIEQAKEAKRQQRRKQVQ